MDTLESNTYFLDDMYPIITEKAPNTYDIFGVKLEPINEIKKTIINSDDPLIIEPSKSKVLKRILSQGASDDLFVKGTDNKQCVDIEYWLNVSQEILLKRAGYFRYNSRFCNFGKTINARFC